MLILGMRSTHWGMMTHLKFKIFYLYTQREKSNKTHILCCELSPKSPYKIRKEKKLIFLPNASILHKREQNISKTRRGEKVSRNHAPESFHENHILKRYLFSKKCNSTMVNHFISLSKDRIKRLPGSLVCKVHRYSP